MKNNKSQSTIWVLVALVVVCCGSFIGVRMLNSDPKNPLPVIVTTVGGNNLTTTMLTTAESTTLPTTTKESSDEKEETTKLNQFTTFSGAIDSTKPTEKETTTETTTQRFTLPAGVLDESRNPVERAAIFSDGFLSYMYNSDEKYYYTVSDPWQRQFGFNELYDLGASFIVFYYDTMRCKFNYDDKDWMIQFWKGQYGFVFIGGEIGVYNKPEGRQVEHYDAASDKDSLYMSMTCFRNGEELFTRPYDKYWWCTGFVPGQLENFTDRTELSIRAKITMKDQKMLKAFCNSLEENGRVKNEDYTVNKLDVYVVW